MPRQLSDSELEAVNSFRLLAREFCQLIENQEGHTRRHLIENVLILLSKLLAIGIQLPDVQPATSDIQFTEDEVQLHAKEFVDLSKVIGAKLGDLDTYWSVFDPTEQAESAPCSLSADLAEIYMDLKDSVALLETSKEKMDVYWDWKFDFQEHWARHAIEAFKVALFILPLA